MDRLSVRKQNHPEVPIPGLRNPGPTPDPLIGLDLLVLRVCDDPQNPFVFDRSPIRSGPGSIEVVGCFHQSDSTAA